MGIANIIDRRNNSYLAKCDAVYEPSWHCNSRNGTAFPIVEDKWSIKVKNECTVEEAVQFGSSFEEQITMWLYDYGSTPAY